VTESRNYIQELLGQLQGDQLPLIDFDQLRRWLLASATLLEEAASVRATAELLRKDYEVRIAGMLKGIAAADRKRNGMDEALQVVEQLPSMSGEQLIACYRHTAARFRDAFPASFGYLGKDRGPRLEKLASFKS
jgi:hypothetical protein